MKMLLIAASAVLALSIPVAASAALIEVTPTLAPNAFGSPSYAQWVTNSNNAIHTGASTSGTPGTPTYYQAQSNVTAAETVVTGFPSWKGSADPGTVYGPAFANELGNRMLFGVRVDGQGSQFSASQLSFVMTSNDAGNALGFAFTSYNYNSDYWGVLKGTDNALWTADDQFIMGGANTQLVDGFLGRGSGNSFAAYCPGCSIPDQQAEIDGVVDYMRDVHLTKFTGTYTLAGDQGPLAQGSGTFNITDTGAVPEPATWALMIGGFGLAGAGLRRKRSALVAS